MTEKLVSVLAIFVIGIISFLIGFKLTNANWKHQYMQLKQMFEREKHLCDNFEKRLSSAEKQKSELEKDRNNLIRENATLQNEHIQNKKQVNQLLAEKLKLNEENKMRTNFATKDDLERVKKMYEYERNERMRLEKENNVLKNGMKSFEETQPTKLSGQSLSDKIASIVSKLGYTDKKDDFTKINGIGKEINSQLHNLGIHCYEQLSKINQKDLSILDEALGNSLGRAKRYDWIGQARKFADVS